MSTAYIHPSCVSSPKAHITKVHVVHDDGPDSWALCSAEWDNDPVLGFRWNGGPDSGSPVGNPQSRGVPTWVILPHPPDLKRFIKLLENNQP